jgi:hypothetical protein
MAVVWSSVCALAALAAAVQLRAPADAQGGSVRTRVLPGAGYIRYQVEPGDDEEPAGELIVVHEERRAVPLPDTAATSEPLPEPQRAAARPCAAERAKLVARLFEMQGLQIDPEFALWLERNRALGQSGIANLYFSGSETLLMTAVKSDGIARGLAEDVAKCEASHSR